MECMSNGGLHNLRKLEEYLTTTISQLCPHKEIIICADIISTCTIKFQFELLVFLIFCYDNIDGITSMSTPIGA